MFKLTPAQQQQIAEWQVAISRQAIEQQRKTLKQRDFAELTHNGKFPYYGAIGGGITYSFTPTGLGVVVTVKEALTGEELDVTDYDSW